jgi:serine/threonine-protein kinase
MPADLAVRIMCEALTSLSEAHRKGIIHRDIKPDNLFLARRPSPDGGGMRDVCTVLDFGIAKVREQEGIKAVETQAGMVFGTPRYMSPEQAQGRPLDHRSDLYSLGVILYQMLVGRPPFEEDEAVLVMARHIKTAPKPPRQAAPSANIPESLERIVLRALSKSPNDRPADADQFRLELERVMPDAERAAQLEAPAAVVTSETAGVRARPSVIALVLTLLLTGLGVAAFVVFLGNDSGRANLPPSAGSAGASLPPASTPPPPSAQPAVSVVPLEALPPADDSAGAGGGKASAGPKPGHSRPAPPRRPPGDLDVQPPSATPSSPYRP